MRLIGFATIIVLILIGLVYLMIRPIFIQRERTKDASKAKWKAYSTTLANKDLTSVGVNLITPKGVVLEQQVLDTLPNKIETYDFELVEAINKARLRAQTLNIQRTID